MVKKHSGANGSAGPSRPKIPKAKLSKNHPKPDPSTANSEYRETSHSLTRDKEINPGSADPRSLQHSCSTKNNPTKLQKSIRLLNKLPLPAKISAASYLPAVALNKRNPSGPSPPHVAPDVIKCSESSANTKPEHPNTLPSSSLDKPVRPQQTQMQTRTTLSPQQNLPKSQISAHMSPPPTDGFRRQQKPRAKGVANKPKQKIGEVPEPSDRSRSVGCVKTESAEPFRRQAKVGSKTRGGPPIVGKRAVKVEAVKKEGCKVEGSRIGEETKLSSFPEDMNVAQLRVKHEARGPDRRPQLRSSSIIPHFKVEPGLSKIKDEPRSIHEHPASTNDEPLAKVHTEVKKVTKKSQGRKKLNKKEDIQLKELLETNLKSNDALVCKPKSRRSLSRGKALVFVDRDDEPDVPLTQPGIATDEELKKKIQSLNALISAVEGTCSEKTAKIEPIQPGNKRQNAAKLCVSRSREKVNPKVRESNKPAKKDNKLLSALQIQKTSSSARVSNSNKRSRSKSCHQVSEAAPSQSPAVQGSVSQNLISLQTKKSKSASRRPKPPRLTRKGKPYRNPVLTRPRGVHTPVLKRYTKKYTLPPEQPPSVGLVLTRASRKLGLVSKVVQAKQEKIAAEMGSVNICPAASEEVSINRELTKIVDECENETAKQGLRSPNPAEPTLGNNFETEDGAKLEYTSNLSTNKGGQSSNQSEIGKGSTGKDEGRWLSPDSKVPMSPTAASEKNSSGLDSFNTTRQEQQNSTYLLTASSDLKSSVNQEASQTGCSSPEKINPFIQAIQICDSSQLVLDSPKSPSAECIEIATEAEDSIAQVASQSQKPKEAAEVAVPLSAPLLRLDPIPSAPISAKPKPQSGVATSEAAAAPKHLPMYELRNNIPSWSPPSSKVLSLQNSKGSVRRFPVFHESTFRHPSLPTLQNKLVSDVNYDEDQSSDEVIVADGKQKAKAFFLKNTHAVVKYADGSDPSHASHPSPATMRRFIEIQRLLKNTRP